MRPGGVNDIMHRKRGMRIFGDSRKVSLLSSGLWGELSFSVWRRRLTFGARRGFAAGAVRGVFVCVCVGGQMKKSSWKDCASLFLMSKCYVLTFWTGQKCHSRWCTGKKWHILIAVMRGNHVGGNWLMKWDEVKKMPLYSHRLTHRKRVTSELHDSYFRSMMITQAIQKIAEVTHPDRQIS